MLQLPNNGLVHLKSNHSVEDTVTRLHAVLRMKNLPILAQIDHSGDASKAGLTMPSTKLLIFGNAKSGTPLMIAAPTIAIDLPLKTLIWEDTDGIVWLSYNSPEYLKDRHGISDELVKNIAGISAICEEAVR
jgi:uncharacterized protein (DUF302 family)